MKKILILLDKVGDTSRFLGEYLDKNVGDGAKTSIAKFSDLVLELNDGKMDAWVGEENIKDFDLIYFRRVGHNFISLAGSLAIFLEKLGIEYIDTKFRNIGSAGDKFTSLSRLAAAGVSIPHTMFAWSDNLVSNAGKIIGKLGTPIIAKDFSLQRNSGIFKVQNEEDFKKLTGKVVKGKEEQFLFQEFLNLKREFRLLVMGDKVRVVHTKAVRDYTGFEVIDPTPASNLTFVDPNQIPEGMKELAVRAAKALDTEIAGVDVCEEEKTGKYYILEVNRGPGFWHDPEKSPELPELAKFFSEELGKKK